MLLAGQKPQPFEVGYTAGEALASRLRLLTSPIDDPENMSVDAQMDPNSFHFGSVP